MSNMFARLIEPRRFPAPEKPLFTNGMLKALIIPLIIEQILSMLVGMADTVMVSHAGEAAISGVSLVDMINGVFLYVFAALATGGAIIVSQYIGSGDREQGNRAAGQLTTFSVAAGLLFTVAMAAGNRAVLGFLFGKIAPDVMSASVTYLVITAFSYPFMAATSAFASLFRAMGESKITMKVSLGMNVINVVGNFIGVFILEVGVVGVAVASLVARIAATAVMFVMLLNKERPIHIEPKNLLYWNGSMLGRILGVAIPNGVESGIFQICRVAMTSIIATFGTAQIAANGVALSIDNINTIVNSSLGLAMTTVIGQCVGANDYDQATYYIRKMLRIAQFGSMAVNLTVFLSLPLVLSCYDISYEAAKYAYILVCIHTGWTVLLGTTSGPLPTALRAAGDIRFTMIMAIVSVTVGRLFFSYVFALWLDFEIIGMWLAMGTHWSINSGLSWWRFKSGKWKNRKLV